MNNGKAPFREFHSVYTNPQSWKHWKDPGEFCDDAILIKELVGIGPQGAVSGDGYFMSEFIGLKATIRQGRQTLSRGAGQLGLLQFHHPRSQTAEAHDQAFRYRQV